MTVAVPTFSVIVPTHNRLRCLTHCLESLQALDYPAGAWELIVVNDGGAEPFGLLPEDLVSALPLRVHSIEHRGAASARNEGARLATGEILAFLDDDCRVEPDWLQQYAAGFAVGRWNALGGRSINPTPGNLARDCWHALIEFLYTHLIDEAGNALLVVSNNAAYRRIAFEQLGGFDEAFRWSEDWDLSVRALLRGFRQAYFPQARVQHHSAVATPWGYLRQQYDYGRGAYRLERKWMASEVATQAHRLLRGKGSFRRDLWRRLRSSRAPVRMWLLIHLGQLCHRLGKLLGALDQPAVQPPVMS